MPNKSRLWERAVIALLNTRTIEQAARKVGIGTRTLKTWLSDPDFEELFSRARSQILREATLELRKEARESVRALAAIRRNRRAPAAARVRASIAILRFALDAEAQEDILTRIERLERQGDDES